MCRGDEARTVLKVPLVEGCCCCSLRTGVRIIAYLHIFLLSGFFLMVFSVHLYDSYISHLAHKPLLPGGGYEEGYHFRTFYAGFYIEDFIIMKFFGTIVFAVFLLYGTYKEDAVFLEPWLILNATSVCMTIFNVGLLTILRFTGHRPLQIFAQLLLFTWESYIFIVVHSLYKQYKSN